MTTADVVPYDPTDSNVIDMHAHIVAQNHELIARLSTLGKQPSGLLLHDLALQQLTDMLFDEKGQLQFAMGVDIRLNKELRETVDKLATQLIVP